MHRETGVRRQLGFGIIDVMIAMGLAATLMLGLMSILQYSAKATKSASVGSDWTSLKNSIYQAMTTISTCDMIVTRLGTNYKLTVSSDANYDEAHAVAVPELAYPMGPSVNTIAQTGQRSNGLVVTAMKLWAISPPEQTGLDDSGLQYNRYSVRLKVEAARDQTLQGGGQVMNFQPFTIDFRVYTGPIANGKAPANVPDTLQGCVPSQ